MGIDALSGRDCGAYYNSATYASPTWVEVTRAIDVSINLGKNTAEIKSRVSSWTTSAPGTKTLSVDVGYLHKPGGTDTVFDVLQDMFWNDTVKEFAIMDDAGGIASGDVGLRAHFICTDMTQDQALEDGVQYTFTLEPVLEDDSGTLREPEWYEP